MTNREKIIVSAYTGVLMCDFGDMYEYIEAKFGRPVFTHEMASEEFQKELKEKTRKDFMAICEEPDVPDINAGDLISRQAAKLKVARVIWEDGDSCYDFHDKCVDCLDDVPPVQPERKKGKWIKYFSGIAKCPFCGNQVDLLGGKENNFCGECGADMRGEQDE